MFKLQRKSEKLNKLNVQPELQSHTIDRDEVDNIGNS